MKRQPPATGPRQSQHCCLGLTPVCVSSQADWVLPTVRVCLETMWLNFQKMFKLLDLLIYRELHLVFPPLGEKWVLLSKPTSDRWSSKKSAGMRFSSRCTLNRDTCKGRAGLPGTRPQAAALRGAQHLTGRGWGTCSTPPVWHPLTRLRRSWAATRSTSQMFH